MFKTNELFMLELLLQKISEKGFSVPYIKLTYSDISNIIIKMEGVFYLKKNFDNILTKQEREYLKKISNTRPTTFEFVLEKLANIMAEKYREENIFISVSKSYKLDNHKLALVLFKLIYMIEVLQNFDKKTKTYKTILFDLKNKIIKSSWHTHSDTIL